MRGFVNARQFGIHPRPVAVAHQPRNGKRHAFDDGTAVRQHDSTAETDEGFHGKRHVGIVCADGDDVVRIVRHGHCDRTMPEPVVFEQRHGDVARMMMPLDDGDFDDIQRRIENEIPVRIPLDGDSFLRGEHPVGKHGDGMGAVSFERQTQTIRRKVFDMHAARDGRRIPLMDRRQIRAVRCDEPAFKEDLLHTKFREIVKQHDVRAKSRGDAAAIRQTEAFRGIERCHLNCRDRVDALFDTDAQVMIDVPVTQDGAGLAVVGAEQTPSAVLRGDASEQSAQITAGGTLTHQHIHSAGNTRVHFFHGGTFVIPADARRRIGVERIARNARDMPVDEFAALFCRKQFFEHGIVRPDDPGEVHEFTETENLRAGKRFAHILRIDGGTRVLEGRDGHAGRQHPFHVEGGGFGGADHIIHPRKSADIRNLVRIGNDGGGAVGHDQTAEFFGGGVGRFDVDVAVDETGGGISAFGIDDMFAVIGSDACDETAADGDVALDDGGVVDVDDFAVFNHELRGSSARGGVDEEFEGLFLHGGHLFIC